MLEERGVASGERRGLSSTFFSQQLLRRLCGLLKQKQDTKEKGAKATRGLGLLGAYRLSYLLPVTPKE